MPERNVIEQTTDPLTVSSLTTVLRDCGLADGQTVLVHLSMSKLGWIVGGAEAVILSLLAAVGENGTIMMPTFSNGNTDPYGWENPPVPEAWWQVIRDHMPAYYPSRTPTRSLGVVPELFRSWPGVMRSTHPAHSFAAVGPKAEYLLSGHSLEDIFGNHSPLGKLYELDGHIMLLGVNHSNNTSLHLAEFRANYCGKKYQKTGSAMMIEGRRQWMKYQVLETHTDDFQEIGTGFEAAQGVEIPKLNNAELRFFQQRKIVDFGVQWMEKHRGRS